ncbi:MAG: hypothetical protein HC874_30450 [Richelia sp. SL_2_1]|nr:hypothetical protein [Richelia sp. SL_2_1]
MPVKYTKLDDKKRVPFEVTDNFVSNDGAFGMFVPKYLPIFGSYNTYGRLENIDDTQSFGISKDYITDLYANHKQEYGCFVDRSMWNWAVDISRKDINVHNSYTVGKWIERYSDRLGFVYDGLDTNRDRYNRVFHHISNPDYKFYTDGTWLDGYVHNFDDLIKLCRKNKITLNTESLKNISPIDIDIIDDITKYRTEKNRGFFYLDSDGSFRNVHHLYDLYESIDINILAKELADLLHFSHIMYLCNRMFIPQMSGTQHGEYSIQKQMYKNAIKVCNSIEANYK